VLGCLQAAHPHAAIIGGVATGDHLIRAHAGQLTAIDEGVGALMFSGNVPLTALVSRGARCISGTFSMTDLTTEPATTTTNTTALPTTRCVTVTTSDPGDEGEGAADAAVTAAAGGGGAKAMPVMDAIAGAFHEAGPTAQHGVLLGISSLPVERGYTLHHLDGSLFDMSTRSLVLPPCQAGGDYSRGAMRLYTLDAASCKEDCVTKLGHVARQIEAEDKELLGVRVLIAPDCA